MPTSILDGVAPSDLNLPEKFGEFRPEQRLMVDRAYGCHRRCSVHALPTGAGKSLASIALAVLEGKRTAICTATKGLQQQYLTDFASIGLTNVCGRNNFECVMPNAASCEDGLHMRCDETLKRADPGTDQSACPYRKQYERALKAQLVLTNYAYWLNIHRYGNGLGAFDLLVLDEAHDAPDEVSGMLRIFITQRDVDLLRSKWPPEYRHIAGWMKWALDHLPVAEGELQRIKQALAATRRMETARAVRVWSSIVSKLKNLGDLRGQWVVEPVLEQDILMGYRLDCVWPRTYTEELLLLGTPKVILTSATIVPRTLHLLGLNPAQYDFHSYASSFPPERWPVYQLPTAKLNRHSDAEDYYRIVRALDDILENRLDRKTIIHTGSYSRARMVVEHSRWSQHMLSHTNTSGDAMQAVERFRVLEPPAVLVSPSLTTGYDFPGPDCELQIVIKAPYPDLSALVQRRRLEEDRMYPAYQMAQTLTQICGRSMRSRRDACETYILDDAVADVMSRTPSLFPDFLRKVYRSITTIPAPPEPLPRGWVA